MTRVVHLIDATTDETSLASLALLIERMPAGAVHSYVCATSGEAQERACHILQRRVEFTPVRGLGGMVWSTALRASVARFGAQLAHAWGLDAARTSSVVLKGAPLVMTMSRPGEAAEASRWARSTIAPMRFIVGSQTSRSKLLTRGVNPYDVAVIRPGVDFGAINAARSHLGVKPAGGIRLLFTGPASREGGEYFGLWAAAIVGQIHPGLRVVLPYGGPEKARLLRFMRQIGMAWLLSSDVPCASWAECTANADVMVAPAVDEIGTEPIAWAMAAGVPIVATAVRSVAELLADKHNALLCKPGEPRALASRILTAIEDRETCRRLTETARAQAYELFGVRDFVDHHARVYENVMTGTSVGEGVDDPAVHGG